MSMDKPINFITWNVNGLKRNRVEKFQNLPNADVIFFQETHIGEGDEHIIEGLKNEWRVYYTKYTSSSKGTAILVRKELDLKYEYISDEKDSCGAYVVLKCKLEGQLYTLVSVYNHETDTETLEHLSMYLQSMTTGLLVIGGDFNTVLNPFIDKENSKLVTDSTIHRKLRSCVNKFMKSLRLIDIWRRKNPVKQDYTFQREKASRLDYFFVPEECMWRVGNCEILNSELPIKDHRPMSLMINNATNLDNSVPKVLQIHTIDEWLKQKPHLSSSQGEESSHAVSEVDILSAVHSLQVSDTPRPDGIPVSFYKKNIKDLIPYIKTLYDRIHSGAFNCSERHFNETVKSPHDDSQHFFNVDYLIIATILANRLDDFFESQRNQLTHQVFLMITPKPTFKISLPTIWGGIEQQNKPNLTLNEDFHIWENLRDAPDSVERDKIVYQCCPLTPVLTMLALKVFVSDHLQRQNIVFKESVILCIQPNDLEEVKAAVKNEKYDIKELFHIQSEDISEEEEDESKLPLKTSNGVKRLNNRLQNNDSKEEIIQCLSAPVSVDLNFVVTKVMQRMFVKGALSKFNWKNRRKNKDSFSRLDILKTIIEAVQLILPNEDRNNIEGEIQKQFDKYTVQK